MREVVTAVASVRGRQVASHCSQTGMEMEGQSTPESRTRGKMRARATWMVCSLKNEASLTVTRISYQPLLAGQRYHDSPYHSTETLKELQEPDGK